MANTTLRVGGRKRRSLNKRMRVLNKKTKVARRNGSRRRIKMIVGGAKWIKENRDNLLYVWNSLFLERAKPVLGKRIVSVPILSTKRALFVIDMQLDFMDRDYERDSGELHPVHFSLKNGNFAVVQAGTPLVEGVIKKIQEVLKTPDGLVIFSRDYHPKGHSSFNKNVFFEKNLCGDCNRQNPEKKGFPTCLDDDSGVFPAHCVQGKQGSRFIPEIEELINKINENENERNRVKIAFKGIHMKNDSYTAVDKNVIDAVASNKKPTCKACSNFSGGYELVNGNDKVDPKVASNFMGNFIETEGFDSLGNIGSMFKVDDNNDFELMKIDYTTLLSTYDVIEVCGLAGDYCVRDTVVALAQKFKEQSKSIVLLGDLTSYPSLPFGTIRTIPQHVSESKYAVPNYSEVTQYKDRIFELMLENALDTGVSDDKQQPKDITSYLLMDKESSEKDDKGNPIKKKTLLSKEDVDKLRKTENIAEIAGNLGASTIFHFITPHQEIVDDYLQYDNIMIQLSNEYASKYNAIGHEEIRSS